MNPKTKKQIRQELRSIRTKISADEHISCATKIQKAITNLSFWQISQNIAIYLPMAGEIDVLPILEQAWQEGKTCYLPVVKAGENAVLEFVKYQKNDALRTNTCGAKEPLATTPKISPEHLDLVIVPLVGFNESGMRLGQGGGFYDRTFAFKKDLPKNSKPLLIGVAYELQKIRHLPKETWDVAMDLVITEKKIYTDS
ncbi:MAG: 5-formyltetrahydrofolate cyclo-ligase [Gammaproteobacteria bacterium]